MRDGSNMAMRTSSLTELRALGHMAVTAMYSSQCRLFVAMHERPVAQY